MSLGIASTVCNSLSIAGTTFIAVNIAILYLSKEKEQRRFSRHMFLLLSYSISQWILGAVGIVLNNLDPEHNPTICIFQTLHITFFNLVSWFYSCAIVLNIFVLLKIDTSPQYANADNVTLAKRDSIIQVTYQVICLGVPLVLVAIVAIFWRQFEYQTGWCWISVQLPFLRIFCFYIWAILSVAWNLFWLICVTVILLKEYKYDLCKPISALSGRIAMYAVVFVLCWIWGALIRIIQLFDMTFSVPTLMWIHTVLSISCPFWIAIVFTIVERIWIVYWNLSCSKSIRLGIWKLIGFRNEVLLQPLTGEVKEMDEDGDAQEESQEQLGK